MPLSVTLTITPESPLCCWNELCICDCSVIESFELPVLLPAALVVPVAPEAEVPVWAELLGYEEVLPLVEVLGEVEVLGDVEVCEPLVLVSLWVEPLIEPLVLPAVAPAALPLVDPLTPPEVVSVDCGVVLLVPLAEPVWLVDPAPVENVSFEVDLGSLLGLVLVALPVWLVELAVDPLMPEVDASLCPLVVLLPVFPEMLPEVLGAVEPLPAVAPAVPAALGAAAFSSTFRLFFTDCTPATDFAISLARFLSSLLATVPSRVTLPLSTATCTALNAVS